MAEKNPSPAPETQASRRIKYGLNLAVAVVAAVGLVVLINWIAYRQYVRFDWTATRKYSLSQQTERVLDNLEGDHRVVMLFRADQPELAEVRDLINEYGRYSGGLRVEYIDPDREIARRDAFLASLLDRHEDSLRPTREAIEAGRAALTGVSERMTRMVEPIREAAENPELTDAQLKEFLASLQSVFTRQAQDLETLQTRVQEALDEPLPEYPATLDTLRNQLRQINDNILSVVLDRFERARTRQGVPTAVQDRLLGLIDELKAAREEIRGTIDSLRGVAPPEAYTQLVESIRSQAGSVRDAVVAVGPEQVRIIDIADMFRQPDPQAARQGGEAELQFIGEERLTGALLSMSIERPAMVVFVSSGQQPAIGPNGQYEYVAQRLRAANFRVEQWRPGGGQQMGPMGPMPGQDEPPPQPDAGQQTIWVYTPTMIDPRNPMAAMAASGAKGAVAEQLRRGLERGDAAMLMLAPDTAAQFGAEDPIVAFLGEWGVVPQVERVVFREVQLPDRQTQPDSRFTITRWPDELPITRALAGMAGVFVLPTPIVLGQQEGVESWPLAIATGERLWAETGFGMISSAAELRYDEADAVREPVIAAAAQKGGGRLIVTTAGGMAGVAPNWASDGITTLSRLGVPGQQYVDAFGAMFPGNAELFVNGVYWLAGLDELIAASPRSQDIRRIGEIQPGALTTYRTLLLGGVPIAVAVVGGVVWLVRRRG